MYLNTIDELNTLINNAIIRLIAISAVVAENPNKLIHVQINTIKTGGGINKRGNSYLFYATLIFEDTNLNLHRLNGEVLKVSDHSKKMKHEREGSNILYQIIDLMDFDKLVDYLSDKVTLNKLKEV